MLNRKSFLGQIGSVIITALIAKLLPVRALKDNIPEGQQLVEKSPYVFLFSDEEQGQVVAVIRMSDLATFPFTYPYLTYPFPCWLREEPNEQV